MIKRPRLSRSNHETDSTLHLIRERGFWVRLIEKVYACSDRDDNMFLECVQAADADYLVTGNAKHFPAAWGDTQIVTARQFLDAVM